MRSVDHLPATFFFFLVLLAKLSVFYMQGRPWLTRGPVRGMEWGPPRSVCNGVTGGGGGGVAPPKGRPCLYEHTIKATSVILTPKCQEPNKRKHWSL